MKTISIRRYGIPPKNETCQEYFICTQDDEKFVANYNHDDNKWELKNNVFYDLTVDYWLEDIEVTDEFYETYIATVDLNKLIDGVGYR